MHVFVFLSAQTYGLLGFTNSYYTGFPSPFRFCLVLDLERNSNVWSALNVWLHLAKKALCYLLEALEEYHIFFVGSRLRHYQKLGFAELEVSSSVGEPCATGLGFWGVGEGVISPLIAPIVIQELGPHGVQTELCWGRKASATQQQHCPTAPVRQGSVRASKHCLLMEFENWLWSPVDVALLSPAHELGCA